MDLYILQCKNNSLKQKENRITICLSSKEHFNLCKYSKIESSNNIIFDALFNYTNID